MSARTVTRASALAALALLLAACGGTEAAETSAADPATESAVATETAAPEVDPLEGVTLSVASLRGPTTMGLVGLIDEAGAGSTDVDYEFSMHGTPDEIVPQLVQGEIDVALIPANLAAVLYQRTAGTDAQITALAVNTLGVLYVVESGDTVQSMDDLAGHTVYSMGRGTTPQYVVEYLLAENGLTDSVTVEYLAEATEVAARLAAEPGAIAVLPQPYVTVVGTQNPDVRVALDLTEEWAAVSPDSQLVTGVVVARADVIAAHPEAIESFLADYEESTVFVNAQPAEAAPLIVEAGIVPAAPIAEAAIPKCYITYLAGANLRDALAGYLQVLYDANPESVGGSVPGDDFYYGS